MPETNPAERPQEASGSVRTARDELDGSSLERSADYQTLAPAAILLWRIEGAISMGILLAGALFGGSALWMLTPTPWWVIVPAWLVVGLLFFCSTVWLPARKFAAWSYRLDSRVLELRSGVLWQNSVLIPVSRIQHVDLDRGPLQRRYGVASLKVYTAGTQSASHEIPCLQEQVGLCLREDLVEAAGIPPQ